MKRSSIVVVDGLVLQWASDKGFWTLQRNGAKCWIYPDGTWTINCESTGHGLVTKTGRHLTVDAAVDGLFAALMDTGLLNVLLEDAEQDSATRAQSEGRNTTSVVHGDPHCQWRPDDTFVCEECKRVCCYCAGGDGDELCNDCSVERGDVDP